MKVIIRSHDRLVTANRYLIGELQEIARIAAYDYASNDAEHDALTDCAAIARHAIVRVRDGGAP